MNWQRLAIAWMAFGVSLNSLGAQEKRCVQILATTEQSRGLGDTFVELPAPQKYFSAANKSSRIDGFLEKVNSSDLYFKWRKLDLKLTKLKGLSSGRQIIVLEDSGYDLTPKGYILESYDLSGPSGIVVREGDRVSKLDLGKVAAILVKTSDLSLSTSFKEVESLKPGLREHFNIDDFSSDFASSQKLVEQTLSELPQWSKAESWSYPFLEGRDIVLTERNLEEAKVGIVAGKIRKV